MHADTAVALVSVLLATIIAVSVPWVTFRLALRQDQARWLREQRAQLYVDLLTEAYAEQQWLTFTTADEQAKELVRKSFPDLRLKPLDRARLGTRAAVFGSQAVNRRFNELSGALSAAFSAPDEGQRMVNRVRVGRAFDALQSEIRNELGADRILLDASTTVGALDAQTGTAPEPQR